MARRPRTVAFDIIGATFSLEPMRDRIAGVGLPATVLELWFAMGLRDAFALAASGTFQPFKAVLASALGQVLTQHPATATAEEKEQLLKGMQRLPAHRDTRQAFEALAAAGIAIIALSNGVASGTA